MDASRYFKGKKITVLGLGLLGRGVGDVQYLAECGTDLIVTDRKSAEALAPSVNALKQFSNIQFVLGEHRLEDFRDRDLILKGAGVPLDSPYVEEARSAGIPIKMSTSLFAELAQIPTVGVTGTRGKSTTTFMINEILEHAGKKVLLGGNVRGVSTLALLPQVTPEHIALFELDSWQLQGFGEANLSPNVSVFTTFFPDHLNYYDSMDSYLADKAKIFLNQKEGDTLVLGDQCADLIKEKYSAQMKAQVSVVGEHELPADWKLQIPGVHNRYGAALARAATHALGISDKTIREALESFKGVPGRLELITTKSDIPVYNDNNATTPEATIAALKALGEDYKGRIVLIMGGSDKGLDMEPLLDVLPHYVKKVVLLSGTGTDHIRSACADAPMYDAFEDVVKDAMESADAGDVVLFSPAFSSFGIFTNEYDRNDQFVALIEKYGNGN